MRGGAISPTPSIGRAVWEAISATTLISLMKRLTQPKPRGLRMITVSTKSGIVWEITNDRHQWILTQVSPSSKTEGKFSKLKSFHGTLKQALAYMLDQHVKGEISLDDVINALSNAENDLDIRIRKAKGE